MSSYEPRIELDHPFKVLRPRLYTLETIGSTNDFAKSLIRSGVGEGAVIVARRQSSGRGRFTREWHSPEGGLYMSIILRPHLGLEHAPLIGLLCGCAAAWTIQKVSGENASLKWPNDIMIDGKKVGGILSELVCNNESLIIVGIGINLNNPIDTLPSGVRKTATTLVHELGREVSMDDFLTTLIRRIDFLLDRVLATNTFDSVISEWRGLSSTLGNSVIVNGVSGIIRGEAVDIDSHGRLKILCPDGTIALVAEGDIRLVRTPNDDATNQDSIMDL